MCGGSGTRLWPLSRAGFPKQFISIFGKNSLFQNSIDRLLCFNSKSIILEKFLILTGEEHRFLALQQFKETSDMDVEFILEPESKNTAPALTLAALHALKSGNDPVLVVTPADHMVERKDYFAKTIKKSIGLANDGNIVVLGIKPRSPETGFGYIKKAGIKGKFDEYDVESFVEKPTQAKANLLINDSNFFWNSGIFIMKASIWLDAINFFRKKIYNLSFSSFESFHKDGFFLRPEKNIYSKIYSESIDYAVIENCPGSKFNLKVIPANFSWSDLGSWSGLLDSQKKDSSNNYIYGDVIKYDAKENIIFSDNKLVAAFGVDNLVIVDTSDALLVAKKQNSQSLKKLVDLLNKKKRQELFNHRKVLRPWGWYDTIDFGKNFKVKRISVNPHSSLSLQKHKKRAEHWIVVEGEAEIICGNKKLKLKKNQSTYIPAQVKHRLSNITNKTLEIIEVQSGDYLGEDDIERYEDFYGRI